MYSMDTHAALAFAADRATRLHVDAARRRIRQARAADCPLVALLRWLTERRHRVQLPIASA